MKYYTFQDPSTPIMEGIIDLHTYIMFYLIGIVAFVFVGIGLTIHEFYLQEGHPVERMLSAKVVHATTLELIWTVAPLGVLLAIAFPSFALLYAMEEKYTPDLTLKAVGHQWYWEYQYNLTLLGGETPREATLQFDAYMTADADLQVGDLRLLETDRTVLLPVRKHIRLLTTSADVIHSWALPAAGVKMDAIPGRLNQVNLYFNRQGLFYGQCSELCGVNHGFMPIAVKVLPAERFLGWASQWS